MFRLRCTIDVQPRTKNGQPPQSTTGVASTSSIHSSAPPPEATGAPAAGTGRPPSINSIGAVSASDIQKRRVMSSSSGLACLDAATMRGSSAIPQIGHAPGPTCDDLRMHRAGPLRPPHWCDIHWFERHAALRAGARPALTDLRVHGTGELTIVEPGHRRRLRAYQRERHGSVRVGGRVWCSDVACRIPVELLLTVPAAEEIGVPGKDAGRGWPLRVHPHSADEVSCVHVLHTSSRTTALNRNTGRAFAKRRAPTRTPAGTAVRKTPRGPQGGTHACSVCRRARVRPGIGTGHGRRESHHCRPYQGRFRCGIHRPWRRRSSRDRRAAGVRSRKVRTGSDGSLGITFKDDTRFSLGPASEVHLSRFAYAPAEGRIAPRPERRPRRRRLCVGPHCQAVSRCGQARDSWRHRRSPRYYRSPSAFRRNDPDAPADVPADRVRRSCWQPPARRAKIKPPELPGQAWSPCSPTPKPGTWARPPCSNAAGRVELTAARDITTGQRPGRRPTPSRRSSSRPTSGALRRRPGGAAAATASLHVVLPVRLRGADPESRDLAPEILRAVRDRRVPERADRRPHRHDRYAGQQLCPRAAAGQHRAQPAARDRPRVASIDVVSHGETELLVPTGDGIFEARNRRVEITVR